MLTIGQLAAYAKVTTRAVRHYHQIGLLAEPERDPSGYRSYGARDVIELIRIRTLAEAGVPLSRVRDLLDADGPDFESATREIDQRLREEIRTLQKHRRRIARLASGDALVLPPVVTDYLDLLRERGVSPAMVEGERDGWLLIAARWPEQLPDLMAVKTAQINDPRVLRLYLLLGRLAEKGGDDDGLSEAVDLMVELFEEAERDGNLVHQGQQMADEAFVELIDSLAGDAPIVQQLRAALVERGWSGWTVNERISRGGDTVAGP